MASKRFNAEYGLSVGNASAIANVIDSVGNVSANVLTVSATANIVGNANVGNLGTSGNVTAAYFIGNGSQLTGITATSANSIANGTSNVNIPTASGNVQVSVAGTANVITFTSTNAYRGSYNLTGMLYQANTAPSNPQPGDQWYNTYNGILFEYLNDGTNSQWVDVGSLPYPNVTVANASAVLNNVQTTGTYYPAFISSTANGNYSLNSNTAFSANLANGWLGATLLGGTLTTAAQPNITSVGTLTSLSVTGNTTSGNFIGTFANGNSNIAIPSANGNINISAGGTPNELVITNTGVNVSGTLNATGNANVGNIGATNANVTAITATGNGNFGNIGATAGVFTGAISGSTTLNITGNSNVGNLGTAGLIVATGNVSGGNLTTGGALSVTGNANVGNLGVTNTASVGNSSTDGIKLDVTGGAQTFIRTVGSTNSVDVRLGVNGSNGQLSTVSNHILNFGTNATTRMTIDTSGNVGIGNTSPTHKLSVTGTLNVSGNANVGNLGTAGLIVATGNITGGNLIGTYANGNSNIAIPSANGNVNITSGGNLTLIVTPTGANITGTLNATGNANVGNLGATNIVGTLATAAQTNITSVGTLTSLSVSGTTGISSTDSSGAASTTKIIRAVNGTQDIAFTPRAGAGSYNNLTVADDMLISFANTADQGNANLAIVPWATATSGIRIQSVSNTATIFLNATNTNVSAALNVTGNISAANVISTTNHIFSVATGISAAGTTQATGTAISKDFNVVSTVLVGNGVTLPTAVAGMRITVVNTSANALNVYPLGNGIINTQAANAAYSQPAGARLDFICTAAATAPGGQWYTLNATYG